jgi:multicomponent Na+:H+ antiporter subunit B
MTARGRRALFLFGAAGLAALLLWGFSGLPTFGTFDAPYGDVLNTLSVVHRHVTGVVTAINFDIRGFDTIGEEFILFAAVMGTAILLRAQRLVLVGPTVLYGLYVIAHANLTPGGGFQGGVVLATALLMVYLAGEFETFDRVSPDRWIEAGEAAGAGGFVAIGLVTAAVGGVVLDNVLPFGRRGNVLSGGTIPVINLFVGLAVTSGFVLMLTEFLEQALLIRRRK